MARQSTLRVVAATAVPEGFDEGQTFAERAALVRARIEELHQRHRTAPVDVVSYYPAEAEDRPDVFGLSGVHVSGLRVSGIDAGGGPILSKCSLP